MKLYVDTIYMVINLGNEELIDKYEDLGIELNKIFIELLSRYKNKELTEMEWGHISDIGCRRGSELVDYFDVSNENIKKGFSEVADILTDENR